MPTSTPPTPVCAANAGFWEDGWVEFYVTDRCRVRNFAVYVYVTGCGGYKITHTREERINDDFFNFQGEYMANGTFTDQTHVEGRVNIQSLYIPGCGTVSGRIWDYTAAWKSKRLAVSTTNVKAISGSIQSVGEGTRDSFLILQPVDRTRAHVP